MRSSNFRIQISFRNDAELLQPFLLTLPSRAAAPGTIWTRTQIAELGHVVDRHRLPVVDDLVALVFTECGVCENDRAGVAGDNHPRLGDVVDCVVDHPDPNRSERMVVELAKQIAGGRSHIISELHSAGANFIWSGNPRAATVVWSGAEW